MTALMDGRDLLVKDIEAMMKVESFLSLLSEASWTSIAGVTGISCLPKHVEAESLSGFALTAMNGNLRWSVATSSSRWWSNCYYFPSFFADGSIGK